MAERNKNRASGGIYVAAAKTTRNNKTPHCPALYDSCCWCHVFSQQTETRRQQVSLQPQWCSAHLSLYFPQSSSSCVSMGIIEIRRGAEALPRATLIDWVPPSAVLQRTHPIAIYFPWTRARQVSLKFRCPMIQRDGDRSASLLCPGEANKRAGESSPHGSSSADQRAGD